MRRIEGDVKIGALQASVTPRAQTRQILSLQTEHGVGSTGACVVELAGPSLSPPAIGDPVQVSLGAGDGTARVFTGEVLEVARTPTALRIACADALARLARLDVEAAYESTTAGAIVKDVLGKGTVTVGTVTDGPSFPSYVLHRGPRALRHLQRLAELCGADLYSNGDGEACFTAASEPGTSHSFRYGQDILDFSLHDAPGTFDSVSVHGEGAGGTQGAGKEHWLITDVTSVSATAALGPEGAVVPGKQGEHTLEIVDGAIRSGEAARQVAEGRIAALASRPLRGFLRVLGEPGISPGDHVTLVGLPSASPRVLPALRVRQIRHRLDARQGFVTRVDF